MKITAQILKIIIALAIILFSVATFMGRSYLQTLTLLMIAATLIYWPTFFKSKWNKTTSTVTRLGVIVLFIFVNVMFFKPEPKSSIYLSEERRKELMEIYDEKVNDWPEGTEDLYIETKYGKVHILACGSPENPPLMMIHAASMGAHSWAENLEPLLDNYRIYSFDNIGEGNKSELKDALVYPNSQKEIADLYALLADSLGIESSSVFGASNGGFVAMCYAYHYPERVKSLALFGPMGLTQLSKKSFGMLTLPTMYPFQFVRDYVAKWAIGEGDYIKEKYVDWFDCIMRATIPSVAAPMPMTTEQKQKMDLPVLLFLGTKDAIVGDVEIAKQTAEEFPNIQVEILESGHLVAVEQAEYVNGILKEFLDI